MDCRSFLSKCYLLESFENALHILFREHFSSTDLGLFYFFFQEFSSGMDQERRLAVEAEEEDKLESPNSEELFKDKNLKNVR